MATKIIIGDVGTTSCVELNDESLTLVYSGGCPALKILEHSNLNEKMSDDEIIQRVYNAWIDGYEGDPDENGLVVTVEKGE